jgi:hypothetical protein
MRVVIAALVILAATATTRGEEPAAPAAAPEERTLVHGTLPDDLAGRWIAVAWLDLPNERKKTVPYLWQIDGKGDGTALVVRFTWPPDAQMKALSEANKSGTPWRPSPDDLKAIRDGWVDLKTWAASRAPVPAKVDVELAGGEPAADAPPALWSAGVTYEFRLPNGVVVHQGNAYRAVSRADGDFEGSYEASVDVPTRTAVPGSFRAYRLDPAPRHGLARMLDFLTGCRR